MRLLRHLPEFGWIRNRNENEDKNMKKTAEKLIAFIKESPDAFHAAAAVSERLEEKGYQKLAEKDHWSLEAGKGYYVTRNESAVIAFRMPEKEITGYQIMASHSDSPAFKIKERPEMVIDGHYVKLNVEKYGGMLMAPWFDRPLSVSGRVMVKETTPDGRKKMVSKLVNIDRDLLLIPSLAIHMNREVNGGYNYNAQKDMLPLMSCGCEPGQFQKLVAEAAGVKEGDICAQELFLYSRSQGSIWGAEEEFVSSGRLDDLQWAYAGLMGFVESGDHRLKEMDGSVYDTWQAGGVVPVYCMLDNEEVGSGTKQGAASTFLKDVLTRINLAAGGSEEEYLRALAGSFMVSADNAHALHPNYADKTDPTNHPFMNQGIVIKHSANQKYTTDAVSAAVYRSICEAAEVPVQDFFNRSDMPGGSTLGNIANTQTPMNTVDIGLPQLAMHSVYETAGVKDTEYLIRATTLFYLSNVAELLQ